MSWQREDQWKWMREGRPGDLIEGLSGWVLMLVAGLP